MKKSELKNGAVVELRNGEKCIKIDNILISPSVVNNKVQFTYLVLDSYEEDLTMKDKRNTEYDIVKVNNNVNLVYNNTDYCFNAIVEMFNINANKWTWVREDKPKRILTHKEYKYLKAVIAPIREQVWHITKSPYRISDSKNYTYEVVNIALKTKNKNILSNMQLYIFEKDTQFKGMELYKGYTLKELGLD